MGKIPSTIWDSGKNKFKHGVIAKRQERELTDLDTKLFDHDKIEFALVIVGG